MTYDDKVKYHTDFGICTYLSMLKGSSTPIPRSIDVFFCIFIHLMLYLDFSSSLLAPNFI